MESVLSFIFILIAGILSLLPIAGVVVLIVVLLRKNNNTGEHHDDKKTPVISFKNLLRVYLYAIITIAAFIFLLGFTFIGKAAIGMIDSHFSYYMPQASKTSNTLEYKDSSYGYDYNSAGYICYDSGTKLLDVNGTYYCQTPNEDEMDLINGTTMIATTAIILAIHILILFKVEKEEPNYVLRKIYIFSNLMLYSLAGLISLPIAIYQTFSFLLNGNDLYTYSYYSAPGGILSFAIFTMIIWAIFLVIMLKNKDPKQTAA